MYFFNTLAASAQESTSTLYIPLIGLTSVPSPLALPNGAGNVTYNYAVKNFLSEVELDDIQVIDNVCESVRFDNGDDDGDSKLDHNETWRYTCTTRLSETTKSIATATGKAYSIVASHKAYATVVVGLKDPAPLVSIVNITKVAYPLSLPAEGGKITFTYKVNNPGDVPLSNIIVSDNKCNTMSSRLGDTNANNLLDTHEVWIYTCTTTLTETTTNTARVIAYANGLKAVDDVSITVKVDKPALAVIPNLPSTGENPNIKITIWAIMSGILGCLIMFFIVSGNKKSKKKKSLKKG